MDCIWVDDDDEFYVLPRVCEVGHCPRMMRGLLCLFVL